MGFPLWHRLSNVTLGQHAAARLESRLMRHPDRGPYDAAHPFPAGCLPQSTLEGMEVRPWFEPAAPCRDSMIQPGPPHTVHIHARLLGPLRPNSTTHSFMTKSLLWHSPSEGGSHSRSIISRGVCFGSGATLNKRIPPPWILYVMHAFRRCLSSQHHHLSYNPFLSPSTAALSFSFCLLLAHIIIPPPRDLNLLTSPTASTSTQRTRTPWPSNKRFRPSNMMNTMYATPNSRLLQSTFPQQNYYDDLSIQIPSTREVRRPSRSSHGQRPVSMRVSKPSSVNNSPTTSGVQARRRTMMNDGQALRRQQQILEYLNANHYRNDAYMPVQKPSRPVSWHPSTHMQMPMQNFQQPQSQFQLATPGTYTDYQDMYLTGNTQFSPMLESYSNDTSPSSTFSPLPSSFPNNTQYFPSAATEWDTVQKPASYFPSQHEGFAQSDFFPAANQMVTQGSEDWTGFIMNGFNSTSPPTPEGFLQSQPPQVASTEPTVPAQTVDEPEEEGEILMGMGLYDTPEKHDEDPHLNNYRSTVSSLLGSSFCPSEPRGKGLKLEETWEPPKSEEDDAEDDEDDE